MKIVSGLLLLLSIGLNARYGWAGVAGNVSPEAEKMIGGLGIAPPVLVGLSWLNLLVAGLLLFPATFFTGNLLNAAVILLLIAYALRAGNLQTALVEVPFLLLPLALIWLKHSLAKCSPRRAGNPTYSCSLFSYLLPTRPRYRPGTRRWPFPQSPMSTPKIALVTGGSRGFSKTWP